MARPTDRVRDRAGKHRAGAPRPARNLVVLALLLFAFTRWFVLVELQPIGTDIDHYFTYVYRAVDLHQTPYAGTFEIEYPPAAWWVISGARYLNGPPVTDPRDALLVDASRQEYTRTFRQLMCAADVASFLLFAGIVRRRRPQALGVMLVAYTLSTATLGHLLYDRLDTGMLFLLLAWVYAWTRRSSDRPTSTGWMVATYAVLGLGISYKVVPILAAPFPLVAELRGSKRLRQFTLAAVALLAGAAVPLFLQHRISGPAAFGFLTYHAGRGIEIESLYASIMALASLVGPSIAISFAHGGTDLVGPLALAMKTASTLALAALEGGLVLWMILRPGRDARATAGHRACFAIAGAVILSPVLSPQYFIWALPLALLLTMELAGDDRRAVLASAATVLAIAALTTWGFPYHFYYLGDSTPLALVPINGSRPLPPSPWPFVVLGARNLAFLAFMAWIGARLVRATRGRKVSES